MTPQESKLASIADAIREKDGTTEPIPAYTFPYRVATLSQGLEIANPDDYQITLEQFRQIPIANRQNTMLRKLADVVRGKGGISGDVSGNDIAEGIQNIPNGRLPNGYTEVAYIQKSNSASYFDIPLESLYPSQSVRILAEMEFSHVAQSVITIFNASFPKPSDSSSYFQFDSSLYEYSSTSSTIYYSIGPVGKTSSNVKVSRYLSGKKIVVDCNLYENNFLIDGINIPFTSSYSGENLISDSVKLCLAGIYKTSSTGNNTKIYSCKIYKEGDLVYNGVACKKDTNPNLGGLFDLVNRKFWTGCAETNASKYFYPGPEV